MPDTWKSGIVLDMKPHIRGLRALLTRSTLNAQMGIPEQCAEFPSLFKYFDMKFRTGGKEIKNCIDVSFVENLFWQVSPRNAAPVWTILPKNLQQLYIDFHGRAPATG